MLRAEEQVGKMEISENELWVLSYYRESELAGALVMGRLAWHTDDDDLRVNLTEHCAEEANHAWLWTQTILEVGGRPLRVSETYQSRYYAQIGQPTKVLEVLALTQVFEKRVLKHFRDHQRQPDVHPAVARTLQRMVAEEVGHIGWVKNRLDRCADEMGAAAVEETLRRFVEIDRKVYADLLEYRDCFRELVDPERRSGRPAGNGRGRDRSPAAVERKAREIIAGSLGIRSRDLDPDMSLSMLGFDSLNLLATISAIEETFRVELSPTETERLYTLGNLIETVTELVAAQG
ncbi:MAG: phosphopantetheine-binding protein [Gemmatimonadota bacterium]